MEQVAIGSMRTTLEWNHQNMDNFNTELQELRGRLAEREKNLGRLRKARADLGVKLEELDTLKRKLDKERKDVEDLEGLGLRALFHTILSSKVEQLAIERQQFLRAQLKWEQCLSAVAKLKANVAGLQDSLAGSDGLEERMAGVLEKKEALLLHGAGEPARSLMELTERIADADIELRELGEAWAAGDEALEGLEFIQKSLDSARGWGVYDLLGGGLVATAIKHSRMDRAKEAMGEVTQDLEIFRDELSDVNRDWKPSLEISNLDKFGDYLLDGLIFDWIVQGKINKSLNSCKRTISTVKGVLGQLQRDMEVVRERVRGIETERRALIEGA